MGHSIKKYFKCLLYGFLVWLIPFLVSLFFYTKEGNLNIDIFLFKTIMILIGSISSSFFLIFYFRKIESNFVKEGIILGFIWFSLNVLLDLLILVFIFKMPILNYFIEIGVRYLVIPITSITIGFILSNSKKLLYF